MGMWNEYRARLRRELETLNDQASGLSKRVSRGLDASPSAKKIVGAIPGVVGMVLGAGRGVVHEAEGIGDGAALGVDFVNRGSPRHAAAVQSVERGVKGIADYASSRTAEPALLLDDGRRYGEQLNRDLNPAATPIEGSFGDEMRRRLNIGMNQGEAAMNVATAILPVAGELKGAAELGRFAEAGSAKYLKMGASPELADYFATLDDGVGHHSIFPQRATNVAQIPIVKRAAERLKAEDVVNNTLGRISISKKILDSPFNVVKPRVERGLWYRRHYGLDRYYGGGNVKGEFGGGRWRGKDLGWTKYGAAKRLWYGTPALTKGVLLSGIATLEGLGQFAPDPEPDPTSAAPPRRPRTAK